MTVTGVNTDVSALLSALATSQARREGVGAGVDSTQFGAHIPFPTNGLRDSEGALARQIEQLGITRQQLQAELSLRIPDGFATTVREIAADAEAPEGRVSEALVKLVRTLKDEKVEEVKGVLVSSVSSVLGTIDPTQADENLLTILVAKVIQTNDALKGKVINERYPDVTNPASESFAKLVGEIVTTLRTPPATSDAAEPESTDDGSSGPKRTRKKK